MLRSLVVALLAGGLCAAAPQAAPARKLDLAALAGLYVDHVQRANVDGETYPVDDVLEIVPIGADRAYFRTRLHFYNGHLCAIWGVARTEGDRLVYRRSEGYGDEACELRIGREGRSVVLRDGFSCWRSCGMRGRIEGAAFAAASRRPIRYMARLKASRHYHEALAEAEGLAAR